MRLFVLVSVFSCLSFFGKDPLLAPPGTAEIGDNFYVDKQEMTNIGYREYLYWLKKVHGENSNRYKNALPDQTVWQKTELPNQDYLQNHYLFNPLYDNYPVVGVSWEQANDYMNWRTDRAVSYTHLTLPTTPYV